LSDLDRRRHTERGRRVGYPQAPIDADALKRIGPIQNYDDDF